MISLSEIRQHQRPLRIASDKLQNELDQLAERQKELIAQGRTAGSLAQQRILARQVKRLQEQIQQKQRRLARVEAQLNLLNRLLLLRESAAAVQAIQQNGLLQQLDWPAVQRELSSLQTKESEQLARLTAVLKLMEAAAPPLSLPPPRPFPDGLVRVERVVDGDTIEVAGGERVRYIGIDCPELWGWDGRPEPYAETAAARNRQLVEGQQVRLEKDVSDRDRFGRLLRYVYVGDRLINAQLLREGLAYAFPLHPDVAQAAQFEKLESEAQHVRRGIW